MAKNHVVLATIFSLLQYSTVLACQTKRCTYEKKSIAIEPPLNKELPGVLFVNHGPFRLRSTGEFVLNCISEVQYCTNTDYSAFICSAYGV